MPEQLREDAHPGGDDHNQDEGLPNRTFREAVREAQLLLYFASRQGIVVKDTIVAKTLAATYIGKEETRGGKSTKQIEKEFWLAFRILAETVNPVTIESIMATHDRRAIGKGILWLIAYKRPLARWSVLLYSFFAIVTLAAVISLHIYWVVGISMIEETTKLDTEIEMIVNTMIERRNHLESTDLTFPNYYNDNTFMSLQEKLSKNALWSEGAHENLAKWIGILERLAVIFGISSAAEENQQLRAELRENPNEYLEKYRNEYLKQNKTNITAAEFIVHALSTFIVPLLYGLLGAFAYVLREMAMEVRAFTFSHASRIRYNLRLALGLLAGIAVGFLISPDVVPGEDRTTQPALPFVTIGPMALAFVAGYSVELVFALMDKIVSSFVK